MATDKKICERCGKIHVTRTGAPSCSGHLTSDRTKPCKKNPIAGHHVCRTHGGALKKTQIAAQERLALMAAEGEIADLMRECDIPEQHPIDGLLEVVRISGSMMRLLTIKVGELKEDPQVSEVLVEGYRGELSTKKIATDDAFWGVNASGDMVPHTYVGLLRVWTERYERACKTALEAGIEERRIQLAEDTTETFFSALTKAITVVGLEPSARSALHSALAAELRNGAMIQLPGTQ
ncbi:MAG: hypothetical protein ABR616_19220 [Dermatophilaceae bacterium]